MSGQIFSDVWNFGFKLGGFRDVFGCLCRALGEGRQFRDGTGGSRGAAGGSVAGSLILLVPKYLLLLLRFLCLPPPHHRKSLSSVFIFHDHRDVFRAIKKHRRDFALNCSSTICVMMFVIARVSPVLHHSLRRNAVECTQVPTRRSSRMRLGKAAPSPGALGSVSGHLLLFEFRPLIERFRWAPKHPKLL